MLKVRKSAILLLVLLLTSPLAYSNCTLTGTPNNSSGNPLSGCTGIVTISGTLTINGNYNIGAQTITKIIITSTGRINWTVNANLNLPAGCTLEIQPGGILSSSTACNSQKTITIANAPFASCNGNNINYSFAQLMNGGGYSGNNAVTASSNSPVCQGTTLLLTCSPTGGVLPYTFSWTGPGSFTSNVQNPVVNNPAAGIYTVIVSDVLGITATANTTVSLNPLPTSPTGGNNARCGTGTVTISATAPAGNVVDWYAASTLGTALISGSNLFTSPVISSTTPYYAEARNTTTGCVSSTRTAVTATVNPIPTATISYSNSSYCAAGGVQSVIITGQGDGTFSAAAGLSLNPATGEISPALSLSGVYTVTYNFSNGLCNNSTNTSVTILDASLVDAGPGDEVCFGSDFQLNGTVTPAGSTTWITRGDGIFGDASALVTDYTPGLSDSSNGSVWLVLQSNAAGCASADSLLLAVLNVPAAPASIIAPANICTGNSGPVSVIADPNATSYTWWAASPATLTNAGGPTGTLNIPASIPTSGTYISVRAVNACGVSDSTRKWIRSFISNPTLSGPTNICQGSTYTLTGRSIQGADSVRWIFPANTSAVMVNDTTYNVTFGPAYTTSNIVINAYFVCQNTSLSRTYAPVPVRTPGNISGLSTSLCDTTVTFSITPVLDAIGYAWTVPAGATVIGPSNTTSLTLSFNSFSTGTLSVQSINPCTILGPVRSLALKGAPATPASVSGPATACAQQTNLAYSTPLVVGATSYSWTVPGGASILSGHGTNAVTVKWGNSSGNINVKANRACGGLSSARSYLVTVNCRVGDPSVAENAGILYPNPNRGSFTYTNSSTVSGTIDFAVMDLSGRTVKQIKLYQPEGTTDHKLEFSLPEGMYLLKVNSADKISLQKFIVE